MGETPGPVVGNRNTLRLCYSQKKIAISLGGVLEFQRLHSGWASQARQVVGDQDPWSAAIKVDVKLRSAINRVIDVRQRNVDLVGMVL